MLAYVPINSGGVPLWYLEQKYGLNVTGYSVRKARTLSSLFAIATVFTVTFLAGELGVRYDWAAAARYSPFFLRCRGTPPKQESTRRPSFFLHSPRFSTFV